MARHSWWKVRELPPPSFIDRLYPAFYKGWAEERQGGQVDQRRPSPNVHRVVRTDAGEDCACELATHRANPREATYVPLQVNKRAKGAWDLVRVMDDVARLTYQSNKNGDEVTGIHALQQ